MIPDYSKEKLLIDADIKGPGKAVGPYFDETPLKDSLGATLQELQLDGDVNARLSRYPAERRTGNRER